MCQGRAIYNCIAILGVLNSWWCFKFMLVYDGAYWNLKCKWIWNYELKLSSWLFINASVLNSCWYMMLLALAAAACPCFKLSRKTNYYCCCCCCLLVLAAVVAGWCCLLVLLLAGCCCCLLVLAAASEDHMWWYLVPIYMQGCAAVCMW